MFESIAKQWMPVYGPNGQVAPIGTSTDSGQQQSLQEMNYGDLGYSSDYGEPLNAEFLKNLGWTGGSPYVAQAASGGLDGGDVNNGVGYTPEFQQFLKDSGITFQQTPNGYNHMDLQGFDASGNQVGTPYSLKTYAPDSDMWAMAALGGALGGFGAAGAGAFGGGTTLATGAAETGAGLAGTGLPEYAAYQGAGSAPSLVAGPGGLGTEAAVGGGTAGMSSADLAALYGDVGYGAAVSPAEMAAGGASSGGALNTLGGYASDAASYLKANPMLANLGGTAINGLIGAYSSNKALNAQTDATNAANALWAPYRDTGLNALGKINGLMTNPGSITSDPGYQFGLGQGVQALDRSAASKGGLYSGAQQKASQRYGQDYAGTKLNDAYARYGNVAQLGATGTTNMSNNLTNLGQAGAGAALYQGNNLMNGVNNALGQWNFQNGGYGQPWNQSTYKP